MIVLAARRGIAVMELVVVALIVGVLLAIAIPRFTRPSLDVLQGPDAEIPAGASGTLTVRVTSWRGAAQPGVPVAFEARNGLAVTPEVAHTDSSGIATATWFAGPAAGTATIRVHVEGRDTPSVTLSTRTRAATAPPAAAPVVDSAAVPAIDSAAAPADSAPARDSAR
ncbi:MAG TPA: invasin domain 3-containing protein [Gemmatimonadaceae bacterium]